MLSNDNAAYMWFLPREEHTCGGYRGGSPTAVRPSDPALCGSCPL